MWLVRRVRTGDGARARVIRVKETLTAWQSLAHCIHRELFELGTEALDWWWWAGIDVYHWRGHDRESNAIWEVLPVPASTVSQLVEDRIPRHWSCY
jgi:hypothetical protein